MVAAKCQLPTTLPGLMEMISAHQECRELVRIVTGFRPPSPRAGNRGSVQKWQYNMGSPFKCPRRFPHRLHGRSMLKPLGT